MSAQANIKLSIDAHLDAAIDLGTVAQALLYGPTYVFADGTGADQIKQVFADTRTISASSNEDLDLAGGLTNALGQSITFTKIRAIAIKASPSNTNNVLVGGAASAQFASWVGDATDVVVVRPGGLLVLVAPDATGYAVTATSADLLRIANSAGSTSVSYDIVLLGTTA